LREKKKFILSNNAPCRPSADGDGLVKMQKERKKEPSLFMKERVFSG